VRLAAVVVAIGLVGCSPPADSSSHPPIEATYKARCGSCHQRIEPGSHSREQLEAAFGRHRNRLRLTEAQWGQMVDFLAAPEAPAAPPSSAQ
jgi:hypothetical protein